MNQTNQKTKPKAFRRNLAMHPFVIVAITAALCLVLWVLILFGLRVMSQFR
jgi:hypothetical protein